MKQQDAIEENKIDRSKNSADNVRYYEDLQAFYSRDDSSVLTRLRSFALYAPRQVVSDFLVRYELFKMQLEIPGSIFELGVFNGQGLMTYAQCSAILEPNNVSRRIYGFDTFEGFTDIAKSDATSRSAFMKPGGYSISSFDRLTEAIALYDRNRFIGHVPKVELIRGDVTETLKTFLDQNPHVIPSLIHFDMDVYKPTRAAIELLVPRMPKGAVVVFDELNLKDFPGETAALLESLSVNNIALKRLPFCSRISYYVV